jgi:hypothetical protein
MRSKITYILIAVFSLILVTLWWPINDTQCNAEAFLQSSSKKYSIHATKVVVKPWRGEHHVYGIFTVPDKYKEAPFFVLTVPGFGNDCSRPFGYRQRVDDVAAAPGTHLVRDYLRTRIALRLILQGMYNQLNNKENWTLTYPQENGGQFDVGVVSKSLLSNKS